MFQDADWSDEGESPEIDSPSQPLTNGKKKNKKKNKKNTSSTSIGSVNGNSNLKTLTSAVKRKFEKSVDSPNSKKGLISDQSESEETPAKKVKTDSEVGSILRKGIKFSGPEEFLKFMQPVTLSKKERRKINKQEKKQRDKIEKLNQSSAESEKTDEKTPKKEKKKELDKTENLNGNSAESEKISKKEKKKKKNLDKTAEPNSKVVFMKNATEEFPKNSGIPKAAKDESAKFNIAKIKQLFSKKTEDLTENEIRKVEFMANDIEDTGSKNDHKDKLKSAHFRHLNEQLYTQTGSQSLKMFQKDQEAFKIYHEGFQSQAKKWPSDPLDKIIEPIMKIIENKKKEKNLTIADFGCGEARLAKSLARPDVTVHSFDLVKINDLITVCDFSSVPLEDESCNIAVFCLSLMGTNLRDFVKEANRVLKVGGTLKIAEVVSRFKDLNFEEFLQLITKYGFQVQRKDTSNEFFYLVDLKKVAPCKKKPPEFKLKPCLYKKR